MAGRHWNHCNSDSYFSNFKNWWNAVVQTEFSSKNEKVLPRTTKIATAIGFNLFFINFIMQFFPLFNRFSFFDSLAHGLTIIATGGFSTKNMSIGFFDSISTLRL